MQQANALSRQGLPRSVTQALSAAQRQNAHPEHTCTHARTHAHTLTERTHTHRTHTHTDTNTDTPSRAPAFSRVPVTQVDVTADAEGEWESPDADLNGLETEWDGELPDGMQIAMAAKGKARTAALHCTALHCTALHCTAHTHTCTHACTHAHTHTHTHTLLPLHVRARSCACPCVGIPVGLAALGSHGPAWSQPSLHQIYIYRCDECVWLQPPGMHRCNRYVSSQRRAGREEGGEGGLVEGLVKGLAPRQL